uniref:Uncharacterized protein n=1 Tax=uncultured verrucomicrobium HF0500_18J03 TaxID=723599 RepID=E7C596_9BACT|nr:hypothetical protein [uncultured verrucomicrobium HF0500_18J03]
MPETSQEIYHCPSCGVLVSVASDAERVCGECGYELGKSLTITPRMAEQATATAKGAMVQRNVSTRRRPAGRVAPVPSDVMTVDEVKAESKTDSLRATDEIVSDDGHKKVVRRRKKRKSIALGPLLFLGGWAILVMLVVILLKYSGGAADSESDSEEKEEAGRRASLQAGMEELLRKEVPACHATLLEFLKEPIWTGRAQFVWDSAKIAPKMVSYYERNQMWKLPVGSSVTVLTANLILHSPDDPVIEAVFQVDFAPVEDEDGQPAAEQPEPSRREVTFVRDGSRWAIDWEALVRYSPTSWQLFRSDIDGNNVPGEFRLFVRRTTGRFQAGQPVMVLKFFEPREDRSEIWRQDSPPVVVARDSESGLRLQEILERDSESWEPGQPGLWHDDPPGLRRVRVKLYWESTADNRRLLKVGEVLAGNWLADGYEEDFSHIVPAESDEESLSKPDAGTGDGS